MEFIKSGNRESRKSGFAIGILVAFLMILFHPVSTYAQDYFKMGVAAQDKPDLPAAIQDYTLALKQNPKFLPAYVKRGLCYQDLSEYDSALSDFKKAYEIKPGDPDIEMSMGTTYFHLKDYKNALIYLDKALEKMPDNANAQYDLALAKGELKDYQGALKAFNIAIDLSPNKGQFYYSRALVKDQLRDFNGAMEDCSVAIKLKPDYEKAYFLRAKDENQLKLYQKALNDLAVDIKMNPKNSRYYAERGDIEYHQGYLKASIADCDTAISINSIFGEPVYSKALAERDSGMIDSAKTDFDRANKLFKGKSPFVWMETSKINTYTGDYESAAKSAQNALKISSNYTYAEYELAYAEAFMGNDSGASKILNQVVKKDTSFTMAFWLLGRINYLEGNTKAAKEYFDKGIKSNFDPIGVAFCYAFKSRENETKTDEVIADSIMRIVIRHENQSGLRIKVRDRVADLAYVYGVTKNSDRFFKFITEALLEGYSNKGWIENSKELDYLREDPIYKIIAKKYHLKR